jgi:Ca2+-binding RTX toxin-like protein
MAQCTTSTIGRGRVGLRLLVSTGVMAAVVTTGWVAPADAATVYCYGRPATVVGTPASETINAADGVTGGPDVINGLGGNDIIYGLGGDDVICGGDGRDEVFGGNGRDKIAGNLGDDHLDGDDNMDSLEGFQGDDVLDGGNGDDDVIGGDGNNFSADWGDDSLWGGDGDDTVLGDGGNDDLHGGPTSREDDRNGYGGNDLFYAYGGNDVIVDTAGYDFVVGGTGNDFLYTRDTTPQQLGDDVYGGEGSDQCSADANDHNRGGACEIWQPG